MKNKNLLFVYNPKSGNKAIKNHLYNIINFLSKLGYTLKIYSTRKKKDAVKYVKKNARGMDMVICSGGDGTFSETVSGIMDLTVRPVIGYIPMGTTNDFAHTLGIPRDIKKALNIIRNENTFCCDVGKLNDMYFVYVAAFGAFTEVAYRTPQFSKNLMGSLAYILESIKHLDFKTYHCIIKTDKLYLEDDFILGIVSNSGYISGFKNIVNGPIFLNDGLFEVLLIKNPKTLYGFKKVINSLIRKEILPELMYAFKTDWINIKNEEPVKWTIDGEFGGKLKEIDIVNINKAISIIKP